MSSLVPVHPRAIYTRYARLPSGKWAVVNTRHQVIAPSYWHLRHQYTAQAVIAGAGGWVILIPKSQPQQLQLF